MSEGAPDWDDSVHDCLEHLKYELHEWTETHGLDCGPYEHCSEEIWRCVLCGEIFSAADLERAKA